MATAGKPRLYLFGWYLVKFFAEHIALIGVSLALVLFGLFRTRQSVVPMVKGASTLFLFLASMIAANVVLYVSKFSPRHVVGYECFLWFWPFMAIGLVVLLRKHAFVPMALVLIMLGSVFCTTYRSPRYVLTLPPDLITALATIDHLPVSDFQCGFLPRLVVLLSPHCQITKIQEPAADGAWVARLGEGQAHQVEYMRFKYDTPQPSK